MEQFVTVTLENMFSEPVIIGDASLHFALTEVSKRPVVEMDKLFNAQILPHEPLPMTLAPQEVFSFVIKVHACPLGSVEEVGTNRRHVHPSLLLTWRPLVTSVFLVSQFSVPFPTPQAEQLLITMSVPQMPLALNKMFDLKISLTNLASYPRSLAVELPFAEIKSLWSEGVHFSEQPLLENDDKLLQALIKARSQEITILCIEKHVHLGRAEPKGELTANVRCIASQVGLFQLDGIKILDKHNRDDIRTYIIDAPVELAVTSQDFTVTLEDGSESSAGAGESSLLNPLNGLAELRFSTPDPDDKTELVLG
jgi:hypothetical protein